MPANPTTTDSTFTPADRPRESRDTASDTHLSLLANSAENNQITSTGMRTPEPDQLDMSVPIESSSVANVNEKPDEEKPSASTPEEEEKPSSQPDERPDRRDTKNENPERAPEPEPVRPDPGADYRPGPARPDDFRRPGEPRVREVREGSLRFRESEWVDGPNAGTVLREFPDGSRIVMRPTQDGGHAAQRYDANGNLTDQTITSPPDSEGRIRVTHTDSRGPRFGYTATHNRDGSFSVEYGDGTRYDRRTTYENGRRVVHTTGSGPNRSNNFTATETYDQNGRIHTVINMADGSRYVGHPDGRHEASGPGLFGRYNTLVAQASLNVLFYMSQSLGLGDVRRRHGRR